MAHLCMSQSMAMAVLRVWERQRSGEEGAMRTRIDLPVS